MAEGDPLELVGRTIDEKYAVEEVVAEGGFATVYRATHVIWKRPVALKVFKALSAFSAEDRQRLLDEFVQEGALLADLSERSAAIVQARDIGMLDVPGGAVIPYMVLEWLEGATLEAVIADEAERGLPLRTLVDAVRLLDPIAEALALAHRKGIAHRDVKPGNIFVLGDPRGEANVKLLDFGIAKVVSDVQKISRSFTKTSGHVTSFTPAYGAPEQFSRAHGATGPWTDVFALALIVVEMVTGRAALEGEDLVQLAIASASSDRRPTPRLLGATVSDPVEAVFAKALAVKPTSRWQSAGDFWNALRRALGMSPMRATTDPTPPAATRVSEALAVAPTVAREPAKTIETLSTAEPTTAALPHSVVRKWGLVGSLGVAAVTAVVAIAAAVRFFAPAGPSATLSVATANGAIVAPSAPSSSVAAPASADCRPGMIRIPGGSFFMGSDDGLPFERPSHQVTLKPYCIDTFEVTVEKYKTCSDAGRCKRAGVANDWANIADKERKAFDPLCNARDPVGRANHPINCVDWEMAEKFCREQGARLPTEAEWEFAARGADGRKYPWGDEDPTAGHLNACGRECVSWGLKNGIDEKAMYDSDDGFANTAPVGSFPKGASPFGVQDVVGNVWEWVSDWYGGYGKDEVKDPAGPPTGDEKVIRGGSWNGSYPSWVRPTFRYRDSPAKRSYGVGFRCAK